MADKQKNGSGKFIIGAAVGAAVGAVAALLTAPKSGKETREDLKNKATELSQDVLRQLRKLEGELSKKISDIKKLSHKLEGDARREADSVVSRAEKLKERTLKAIDEYKDDAKKKLDAKFIEEIEMAIKELEGLKGRVAGK